jgi:tRNA dimethylallyltransferase
MSAIGYREIVAYLRGKTTLEEAIMLMKRRTRTFVRRQSNWFKTTDNRIKWFNSDQNAVHKLEEVIREWQISIL